MGLFQCCSERSCRVYPICSRMVVFGIKSYWSNNDEWIGVVTVLNDMVIPNADEWKVASVLYCCLRCSRSLMLFLQSLSFTRHSSHPFHKATLSKFRPISTNLFNLFVGSLYIIVSFVPSGSSSRVSKSWYDRAQMSLELRNLLICC